MFLFNHAKYVKRYPYHRVLVFFTGAKLRYLAKSIVIIFWEKVIISCTDGLFHPLRLVFFNIFFMIRPGKVLRHGPNEKSEGRDIKLFS